MYEIRPFILDTGRKVSVKQPVTRIQLPTQKATASANPPAAGVSFKRIPFLKGFHPNTLRQIQSVIEQGWKDSLILKIFEITPEQLDTIKTRTAS